MIRENRECFLVVSLMGSAAAARPMPVNQAQDFPSGSAWLCSWRDLTDSNRGSRWRIVADGPCLMPLSIFILAYYLFPVLHFCFLWPVIYCLGTHLETLIKKVT